LGEEVEGGAVSSSPRRRPQAGADEIVGGPPFARAEESKRDNPPLAALRRQAGRKTVAV